MKLFNLHFLILNLFDHLSEKQRGFFYLPLTCLCFFLPVQSCIAETSPVIIEDTVFDDETVSQMLTVITLTMASPSIPSTFFLQKSQGSLNKMSATLSKCPKIIIFNGISSEYKGRSNDYEKYKVNATKLTLTNPDFSRTKLIFSPTWEKEPNLIKEALKEVKTPFVFIHYHDSLLVKEFDLNGLIATMVSNPLVKYVRLNRSQNNEISPEMEGNVDECITPPYFVPLCRSFDWSNHDHISRTSYYLYFVLAQCEGQDNLDYINAAFKKCLSECKTDLDAHSKLFMADAIHQVFGTYLYGTLQDGSYMINLNSDRR